MTAVTLPAEAPLAASSMSSSSTRCSWTGGGGGWGRETSLPPPVGSKWASLPSVGEPSGRGGRRGCPRRGAGPRGRARVGRPREARGELGVPVDVAPEPPRHAGREPLDDPAEGVAVLGGRLDRRANSLVGAAPADISRHGAFDVLIGWLLVGLQQGGRLHDLPGLTVTALRDLDFHPGLLNRMEAVLRQPFDRRDRFSGDLMHGGRARPDCFAVDVDGAGAAKADAAAEFRACELQLVTQVPQQRHVRAAVERAVLSVHFELNHRLPSRRVSINAGLRGSKDSKFANVRPNFLQEPFRDRETAIRATCART